MITTEAIVVGSIAIAVGLPHIIFSKFIAQHLVLFKVKTQVIRMGTKKIDARALVNILFGIFMVTAGILMLAGMANFRDN